jgi:hypothetical protein
MFVASWDWGGSAEAGDSPSQVQEWTTHLTTKQPNFSVGSTALWTTDILMGIAAIAAIAYTVWMARHFKAYWPFFVLGGSIMNVVYEPLNDIINHCAYPNEGVNHTVFEWGDRPIPLYILLVYVFYFTVPALFVMKKLTEGITFRQWWTYFFVMAACAALFEPLFIANNLWDYYGDNHPLNFTGLPLWWWFANSMTTMLTGTAFHLLRTRVFTKQWQCASFLVLGPIVFMATHTTAGMPTWLAINYSDSLILSTLGSFATLALVFLYMYVFGKVVATNPAEPAVIVRPNAKEMAAEQVAAR